MSTPLSVMMPCGRRLESLRRESLRRKAQSHCRHCQHPICRIAEEVREGQDSLVLWLSHPALIVTGSERGRERR